MRRSTGNNRGSIGRVAPYRVVGTWKIVMIIMYLMKCKGFKRNENDYSKYRM